MSLFPRVKDIFWGLFLFVFVACSQTGGEECDCPPSFVKIRAISTPAQNSQGSPSITITVAGGNVILSKGLVKFINLNVAEPPERMGGSGGPYLLNIIPPNLNLPENEVQIAYGSADITGLSFWIADLAQGPVNTTPDPAMVGKRVLLQGVVNLDNGEAANFTLESSMASMVEIPFKNPVPVVLRVDYPFLISFDLAKVFNSIDVDPSKTTAQEIRDAALVAGGQLDPQMNNGAKAVSQALEEALIPSMNVYYDKNGNAVPEASEEIGDQTH